MRRRPPGSTRTATLFPYPPLFRSVGAVEGHEHREFDGGGRRHRPIAVPRHVAGHRVAPDFARQGHPAPPCASRPRRLATMPRQLPTSSASRSEEHTSELPSLMRISYAVLCLKKKKHELQPRCSVLL